MRKTVRSVLPYWDTAKVRGWAACKLLIRCGLRRAYWDTTGASQGVGLAEAIRPGWRVVCRVFAISELCSGRGK